MTEATKTYRFSEVVEITATAFAVPLSQMTAHMAWLKELGRSRVSLLGGVNPANRGKAIGYTTHDLWLLLIATELRHTGVTGSKVPAIIQANITAVDLVIRTARLNDRLVTLEVPTANGRKSLISLNVHHLARFLDREVVA